MIRREAIRATCLALGSLFIPWIAARGDERSPCDGNPKPTLVIDGGNFKIRANDYEVLDGGLSITVKDYQVDWMFEWGGDASQKTR